MAKRGANDDEFERFKPEILEHYNHMQLSKVMETMSRRGFNKTKSQYERAFKKWNVPKNVTKEEWTFILSRRRERDAQNKSSTVMVRGMKISESRVQKQRRVHEYQTTFDLHAARLRPQTRLPTPPGIRVLTPKSTPSPEAEVRSSCFETNTPWNQLWKWISKHISSDSIELTHSFHGTQYRINDKPHEIADHLNVNQSVHPVFFDPQPYLPQIQDEMRHSTPGITFTLRGINSYLDTLKLFVSVLSNNFGEQQTETLFHWLSHDEHAQMFLTQLLRQKLISVKACAECLLIPAIEHGNRSLVNILINAGVDINIRTYQYFRWVASTALQCAIQSEHRDIVDLLLAHGASDWYTPPCSLRGKDVSKGTIIDLTVRLGDYGLLEKLLDCEMRITGSYGSTSLHTLSLAVLDRRLDLLTLMSKQRPQLWQAAKQQPWLLLEAAAACEGTAILDDLLLEGFDIHVANESGFGSVLAAASSTLNFNLVRRLLVLDANPNSIYFGVDSGRLPSSYTYSRGAAALHVAVWKSDEEMVRLLLEHGADPNQFCHAYPIQIAATSGARAIVDMLIAKDSNVHAFQLDGPVSLGLHASRPAIRLALERGHLDIVEILHNSGAKLAPPDPIGPSQYCESESFASILSGSDVCPWNDGIYWDPWVVAIKEYSAEDLRRITLERYIDYAMTSAHLSLCIITHGVYFTQDLIQRDLLTLEAVLNPLFRSALVYRGDEFWVEALILKLVGEFGRSMFIQHYGIKAAMVSVAEGHVDLVLLFLKAGVDPFAPDPNYQGGDSWRLDRWVILQQTVDPIFCSEDVISIEWLLSTKTCSTLWQTACLSGNIEMITSLLAWEASPTTPLYEQNRKHQLSAAYLTAICSKDKKLELVVAKRGVNLEEVKRTLGDSHTERHLQVGLQYAVSSRQLDLAYRLLDLGANPHAPPICVVTLDVIYIWHTPLQTAAELDEAGLVKKMLASGADVNAKPLEKRGATAIQFAAINGNFEILKILIEAGGDINAAPAASRGRTALEGAAEWGRLDMASYLLNAGVDVRGRTNKNYRVSVYRAWKRGHRTLARMIQDWKKLHYGADDCEDIETIIKWVAREKRLRREWVSDL